jgi:hypothetical protein
VVGLDAAVDGRLRGTRARGKLAVWPGASDGGAIGADQSFGGALGRRIFTSEHGAEDAPIGTPAIIAIVGRAELFADAIGTAERGSWRIGMKHRAVPGTAAAVPRGSAIGSFLQGPRELPDRDVAVAAGAENGDREKR